MSDLEELKKKLYKPGAKFEKRPEAPEIFEPGKEKEYPETEKEWEEITPRKWLLTGEQKRFLTRGLILAGILVILISVLFFWRGFVSFDKRKVTLKIYGPERIISGEEITYVVQYKNNAKVSLNNAKLSLELPDGAIIIGEGRAYRQAGEEANKVISLGAIASQAEDHKEFKIQIMGLKDSQKKIVARLNYQPANIKSPFENKTEFSSVIISVPLVLDIDLPERVVSGQAVNLTLRYLNTSDAVFSDLKLILDYPAGFDFISSYPQPGEEKNIWSFSEIGAREEGRIIISGNLTGQKDEVKSFKARLGITENETFVSLAESLNSSQVSVAPLNIFQTVNGSENYIANPGEVLRYKIKYQNTADVEINNAVITSKLESLPGNILDFSGLQIEKGFFNSVNNTITWNAAGLPALEALAPHSEGELEFSIKIKDKLPINTFNDKNFSIISTAKMDSSNVPLSLTGIQLSGENKLITKLNSRPTLNIKGFYKDALILNSGPLPPKVGQMTTYTIYWQITNTSNDLENARAEAYLPSYMHWTNQFEPAGAEIKYEPATGKIIWDIGKLPAATGILSPVKYVAFQVGLVPSITQTGNVVNLIGDSAIKAEDTFTDVDLSATARSLKSDLPDDSTVGWERGRVSE